MRSIERVGGTGPLALAWLDEDTGQVEVALDPGENVVSLRALDLHGAEVGADTVAITVE